MNSRQFGVVAAAMLSFACADGAGSHTPGESNGEVELPGGGVGPRLQGDALAMRADSLTSAGRPWRATLVLAAALASPAAASPEVRLAGARAAAGWDGWAEVERVLRGASWLDGQFGGEGRELLARSDLERGADARADAASAVRSASDDASRTTRRVLLARAYDRANMRDSAAENYLGAAARVPRVADWLRLRAAGVTPDSATRAAIFARVETAVPRARIAATDAQARERGGDLAGAARSFRTAGDEGAAFRVEGLAARDEAARSTVVRSIAAYLRKAPVGADARQALDVLDKLGPLAPSVELVAAHAAVLANVPARAVVGFTRLAATSPLSPADRMSYAAALARVGKTTDALRVYGSIGGDSALVALAGYQRARILMQVGDGTAARAMLLAVSQERSAGKAAAAPALLLLADLQVDDGDLAGASQSLRQLTTRYPDAPQAPLARFRAGLLQWVAAPALAAAAFDSLSALHPSDDEAVAARYWAGRAYEKAGRSSEAAARWHAIILAAPLSYYALRASERLHIPAWTAPAGSDTAMHVAAVDSAVKRVRMLRMFGLEIESRFELDALASRAERVPADAPAIAQALFQAGEPARGLRVALAAIAHGTATRAVYRIAYPVVHGDALVDDARKNGLDPALVAGLIRQESSWNPHAVSPASARGLMQLLPSVGAAIAAAHKYPLWNPALLFEPDVNIDLGTAHLAASVRNIPPERALAAYNAGASRVARWVRRPGADDHELFTEWIPFTETRDYVRIVTKNAAIYRALYALK